MALYLLLPLLFQKSFRECALRGALLLAVGVLAAGCFVRQDAGYHRERQALLSGQQAYFCGTVVSKEQKNDRWQFTLSLPGYENQVIVSAAESGAYPLGCVLWVKGTIKDFGDPRNEGQFNEKIYYKSKQVTARIYAEEIRCIRAPSGISAWRERLYVLREGLCRVFDAALPAQEAGILSAMAAGEKAFLDAGTKSLFQRAGISHILAISGMHISLTGMGLYVLLRKCRLGYAPCAAVTAGVLYLYGTMTGMSVSAGRAIGMFFIYLLAQCLGRGYDALSALSVLALVMLFDNPFLLHNVSFQFSFAAVFAVVTIGGVLPEQEDAGRMARMFRALGTALLLQLCTLPLVAYYYYELPLYALFLNLLLLPYLGAALGFGLAGGAAGVPGVVAAPGSAVCAKLAHILLWPCHMVLAVYLWVCEAAAQLPFSTVICGRPSVGKLWLYYGLLALVFWRLRRKKEQTGGMKKALKNAGGFAVTAGGLLALLCHSPAGGFEIDYLDVGQGDGSMLRTKEGIVCFVDGGSSDVSGVGTYRILPFLKSKGIRRVDYWVLSHLDGDHVSGFYEVLEAGYEIGAVVLADEMPEDEAGEKLLAATARHQVSVIRVCGGGVMQLHNAGDTDSAAAGGECIRFLSPGPATPFSDRNGASLVCLYEDAGLRALWTGDIGEEQETWLLADASLPEIDIYKAAHHGSGYSNSAEYLEMLSPRISIVSCGENNRYGHPAAGAVANMEAAGSLVFYTMESGQVKIRRDGNGLAVEEFLQGRQDR